MGKESYGYPIPENANPEDYNCLLVFYPNDELYRRELFGALDYFGTWVAWERDSLKRGMIAARAWKIANEKTRENMGCLNGLGDILTSINVTLQLIAENMTGGAGSTVDLSGVIESINNVALEVSQVGEILESGENNGEDMSTIVNVNCGCVSGSGCGCGDGQAGGGVDYTTPPPLEPPVIEPPVTEPPINPDNSQKCSMANYLVYTLRLTLLKVQENGGDFVTFSAWASTLFTSPIDFVYALSYQTWAWAKQTITGSDIDTSSIFDEYYNFYVCNLFSSANESEAHSALMGSLYDTLKAFPDLSYVSRLIANELPYYMLFLEAGEIEIPAGFTGKACCGESQDAIIPLPEMPEGSDYQLFPILSTESLDVPNNNGADVVYTESSREYKHVALNSSLSYHETDVQIAVSALVQRVGAIACYGLVFQFTSSTLTGSVAVRLGTSTGGTLANDAVPNKQLVYHSNDEYANVPMFKDICDSYPNKMTYGNSDIVTANKSGWRSQSYGNTVEPSFKVRVWALCKVA
jgi:hypothetical protein